MPVATIGEMPKNKAEGGQEQQPAERKRVPRSHRWDADVLDAIADYVADQEAPPTELTVMEISVKAWLGARGYWPRKQKKRNGHKPADSD
jgi:hypothetical protein